MKAIDTNILVYAHREELPFHARAKQFVLDLASGQEKTALAFHCLVEFLAIETNRKIFRIPTPSNTALEFCEAFLISDNFIILYDFTGQFDLLREISIHGKISGARFHDARIASVCIGSGVKLLFTADRDFSRFPALKTKNPMVT